MSIDVLHASKNFGSYPALRDVSLHIADGELVALLGPSGSGKTTLLRIIAGLDLPDADPSTLITVHQHRVGFVFQHYALFRHMTVFENVAFGLRVRPRKTRPAEPEIRRRVNELLELIQLERWAKHYPAQLSGGQRQRVALARALAIEPGVLLLDEPFGALDAQVRHELRRWLRTLHERIRITSVLVTHDQEEALEVADRIVIMNNGRIEQVGTPDEVFHNPASEFVVTFLGNVNLFHGRVFVRPHDMEIERASGVEPSAARITRIRSTGPMVRLELDSAGEGAISAELTHDRFRELALLVGDHVSIRVKDSMVFAGRNDYEI